MSKKTSLEYNAIQSKGQRKAPATRTMSEDAMLKPRDRRKLTGTVHDQMRNLSLVAWMVRKHLDYVTDFNVLIRTGNDALDAKLNQLFEWHGRKENFDICKRHSRRRALRLWESHRATDGDALAVMLKTGNLQFIEGDRIAGATATFPKKNRPKTLNDNGLVLDQYGAVKKYAITNRVDRDLVYSHMVDAKYCIFDGYFQRFDQTRGISPLTTAITTFQDLYENWDFTLLKIKLHALFGIAISQKLDEEDTGINDDGEQEGDIGSDEFGTAASAGTANAGEAEINFMDGPQLLRLEPGEGADTIESKTPNSGFLDFSEVMIRAGLLALDIPYTFYDSMKSSFSARIIDRNDYEESCRQKRESIRSFLNQYTAWKVAAWARLPDVAKLMKAAGITDARELVRAVEWIPAGQPWYDPKSQIEAELKAVAGGIQSRQRICQKYNLGDWRKIVRELEEEEREIEKRKVSVAIGDPGQETKGQEEGDGNE
ncbi:hypothetical protein PDESU_03316 [Pontiella desulfatans]|uniref:Phage portal protein, lambda family n=1 Tax=Pontiella desulfatans TaxID=2750659 RepID=A0A6C2U4J9_PONDE|nr:phage portal protein [Pontiella desulfatans]VGO14747.1 hypothetical protein PDESU_03316 [Pontiella desulfatans]